MSTHLDDFDPDTTPCVICGRVPTFTMLGASATGTPAGAYCDDHAEALAEADDLNADQYALTEDERHQVAAALRAIHGGATLDALADRLSLPPHGLLTEYGPHVRGPVIRTRNLAPGDRVRMPHPHADGAAVWQVRVVSTVTDGDTYTVTVGTRLQSFTFSADADEVWGTW